MKTMSTHIGEHYDCEGLTFNRDFHRGLPLVLGAAKYDRGDNCVVITFSAPTILKSLIYG